MQVCIICGKEIPKGIDVLCGGTYLLYCYDCFENDFGTQEEWERLQIGL